MNKEDYPKKVLTLDQQIAQLKDRGLIIDEDRIAKDYLKNISYFRLQGYWWEFQVDKENHKFKEETNFSDVINLYTFDRKLRLLLFDVIERIEIAIRTKLVYYLSIELDHWWFEDKSIFHIESYFDESIKLKTSSKREKDPHTIIYSRSHPNIDFIFTAKNDFSYGNVYFTDNLIQKKDVCI